MPQIGSVVRGGAVDTLPCNTRDSCSTTGDQSKTERSNRSKADRVDSTPDQNSHARATARSARARVRSVSRTHPKVVRVPNATSISAPMGLPFRFQVRRRVRKARPFEQLLSAPSALHSDLFIRQPRYLWICISTPPPVALTSRLCCVAETRTITPA